jgi:FkbM family methyltransferase
MQTLNEWARRALGLLPSSTLLPILSGPARGFWWSPAASGVTAYWRGTYESFEARHFANRIKPGMVVYDIGAHVGYYTLIAARRVGPRGAVFSFEPDPENAAALRQHVRRNRLEGVVTVSEIAVSDSDGHGKFISGGSHASTGHLTEAGDGGVAVQTTTIDTLNTRGARPPDVIKMDVEGAELAALTGARRTLHQFRPTVYLSVHSSALRVDSVAFLSALGYRLESFSEYDPSLTWEILAVPTVESSNAPRNQ